MSPKQIPTRVKARGHQHLGRIGVANGMSNFFLRDYFSKEAINNAPGQMVFYSMDPDIVDANIQFEVRRDSRPTVTTETLLQELQRVRKVTNQVASGINATEGKSG